MEKGKIIIIGSGMGSIVSEMILEALINKKSDPVFIATPERITNPLCNQKTNQIESVLFQSRHERLFDVNWEDLKEIRSNQRIQPILDEKEYFKLVYNEPKSKFHK